MRLSSYRSMPTLLSCQQFSEFLNNFLTHEVSPAVEEQCNDHLNGCECCQIDLQHYQQVIQLAHELEELPLPPDLKRRFHNLLSSRTESNLAND